MFGPPLVLCALLVLLPSATAYQQNNVDITTFATDGSWYIDANSPCGQIIGSQTSGGKAWYTFTGIGWAIWTPCISPSGTLHIDDGQGVVDEQVCQGPGSASLCSGSNADWQNLNLAYGTYTVTVTQNSAAGTVGAVSAFAYLTYDEAQLASISAASQAAQASMSLQSVASIASISIAQQQVSQSQAAALAQESQLSLASIASVAQVSQAFIASEAQISLASLASIQNNIAAQSQASVASIQNVGALSLASQASLQQQAQQSGVSYASQVSVSITSVASVAGLASKSAAAAALANTRNHSSSSLSSGTVAGLVAGVITALLVFGLSMWYCVKRYRARAAGEVDGAAHAEDTFHHGGPVSIPAGYHVGPVPVPGAAEPPPSYEPSPLALTRNSIYEEALSRRDLARPLSPAGSIGPSSSNYSDRKRPLPTPPLRSPSGSSKRDTWLSQDSGVIPLDFKSQPPIPEGELPLTEMPRQDENRRRRSSQ